MTLLGTWLPKELRRERDAIAADSFAPIARTRGCKKRDFIRID